MVEAKAQHQAARDAVHAALAELAATRKPGSEVDLELLRALYWQFPELHVKHIATGAGLDSSTPDRRWQLAGKMAGTEFRLSKTCTICGAEINFALRTRTALYEHVTYSRNSRRFWGYRCAACMEKKRIASLQECGCQTCREQLEVAGHG